MALDLVTTGLSERSGLSPAPCPGRSPTSPPKALQPGRGHRSSAERRMLVARHLRRARPEPGGRDLDRAVDATFDSYGRYWVDSFRLPAAVGGRGRPRLRRRGLRPHRPSRWPPGSGTILVLPHLGGWEWAGFWLTQVMELAGHGGGRAGRAARRCSSSSSSSAASSGMNVVPLGPSAAAEVLRALKAGHVVCLLCDRDIDGDGVEVEFFGERTTLPAGPATLGAAHRRAACCPSGCYFEGATGHHAVVQAAAPGRAPGPAPRRRRAGSPQDIAARLEELIRVAPEQWHLQQPNWPSDYDALDAIGKPHPRPAVGPSARPARSGALTVRIGIVCPYSLTIPGGVQGQVLGLARALRALGHDVRVLGPCDGPPPDAGVTPLGNSLPTAANGSIAPIAPDSSAQLRTIRALRDERFDVVHLHEPFAPGVTQTALLFKSPPLVGTFHAAGDSLAYRWLNPVVRGGRPSSTSGARCPTTPWRWPAEHVGGNYELRVQRRRARAVRQGHRRGPPSEPDHLLRRPPRAAQGPRGAARRHGRAARRRPALDRRRRARDRGAASARSPATCASSGSAASPTREKVERLKAADVFCAPSLRRRVVRRRAARGHGRRRPPVVASDLPGLRQRRPGRPRRPARAPGRRRRPGRRARARCSPTASWPTRLVALG